MSGTQHILELLSAYAEYEKSHRQTGVDDFLIWAIAKRQPQMAPVIAMVDMDTRASKKVNETETAISILLGMLSKYARIYSKTALTGLPVSNSDEFGYLARLSSFQQMPKTVLATSGMDGKTTGMEMVNRLISQELIAELDNPDDKRSKLVRLTTKGRKVLAECYIRMGKVARYVSGDLTVAEKQTLKKILQKLEAYHKLNEAEIEVALLKSS